MKRAICIGCGCDEDNACPIDPCGMFACWWIRFDAAAGVGLCSACEDLVKAWKAGERKPQLLLIADRFYRQAMFLYRDKGEAVAWLVTPQRLLGNHSPRALILAGELDRVRAVLDQLRSGAFI